MLNHLGFFFFFAFFFIFFSKVRVGAKEGGSHYWEMAVAITCGYGGYLLPLLAAHSSWCLAFMMNVSDNTLLSNTIHGSSITKYVLLDTCFLGGLRSIWLCICSSNKMLVYMVPWPMLKIILGLTLMYTRYGMPGTNWPVSIISLCSLGHLNKIL